MDINHTHSVRPSRRQRVFAHLGIRSRASLPSPISSLLNVTSSAARITNSSSPQIASSSTTPIDPLIGASPYSSSSATTASSSNRNLLSDVFKQLSNDDQATLQNYKLHDTSDIDLALEETLAAAKEKQRFCVAKRWTFTFAGRTVVLKEEANKVVGWLNRFAAVGNIVANVDPVYIGLP